MKKLRNNFTNPVQSKMLLELGVPAWTADLYFYEEGCISKNDEPSGVIPYDEVYEDNSKETMFSSYVELPCWSVGRLIEIWELCTSIKFERWTRNGVYIPLLYDCIAHIKFALNTDTNINLDFSKLEE